MLYQAIYAAVRRFAHDVLVSHAPYEVEPGSANRLFQYWMDACKHQLGARRAPVGVPPHGAPASWEDFDALPWPARARNPAWAWWARSS